MTFAYLGALVFSLAGLAILDWRYRLAVWYQPRRSLGVVGIGVAFFLVLDLIGVELGIFFRGEGEYMTGVLVAPEVPLEEVFFLTLLTYQTLLAWRGFERLEARRRS